MLVCMWVQYDMAGWAPKEYNPADNARGIELEAGVANEGENGAPQSGFVWDEASGYYYDAASGFYYDGNRGNVSGPLVFWFLFHDVFVKLPLLSHFIWSPPALTPPGWRYCCL